MGLIEALRRRRSLIARFWLGNRLLLPLLRLWDGLRHRWNWLIRLLLGRHWWLLVICWRSLWLVAIRGSVRLLGLSWNTWLQRMRRQILLRSSQNLVGRLGNLTPQLIKLFIHDIFIIREIRLQPLESAGIILSLKVLFELIKLLIGHLISQPHTDTHLQRLVNMAQQPTLLFGRQRP